MPPTIFTSRELQVISLLSWGMSVKEVADRLQVTYHTVEAHKYHAFIKGNWHSVVEMTHWALAKGITENRYVRQA